MRNSLVGNTRPTSGLRGLLSTRIREVRVCLLFMAGILLSLRVGMASDFAIPFYSIDAGSATRSVSGEYSLIGSMGQFDAGELTGAVYMIEGGFWNRAILAIPPRIDSDYEVEITGEQGEILLADLFSNVINSDGAGGPLQLESVGGHTVEEDSGFSTPRGGSISFLPGRLGYRLPFSFRGTEIIEYTVVNSLGARATGELHLSGDTSPDLRIPAANVRVVQLNASNSPASVAVSLDLAMNAIEVNPANSNRGDIGIKIGAAAADDPTQGVLISSARRNSVDHGQGQGVQIGTTSVAVDSVGYFVPIHQSPSGLEMNTDVAVLYFPFFDDWIAGRTARSQPGGAIDTVYSHPRIGLHLDPPAGPGGIWNHGDGTYRLEVRGIHSQTDGILLVSAGSNRNNLAQSRANADGSWTLFVHDNGVDGGIYEEDTVSFAFIPKGLADGVIGKVNGLGQSVLSSGDYSVTHESAGTYRLTIAGHAPDSGVLMVSPEGGSGVNVDNFVTYEADLNSWLIQVRDLPAGSLQNNGSTLAFSFAFFPAKAAQDDVVTRFAQPSAVKVRIADLLENDRDPHGGAVTFNGLVGATTSNGNSLTLVGTDWIVYQPSKADETPDDRFRYRVGESSGRESIAEVVILEQPNLRQSQNLVGQIAMGADGRMQLKFRGIPQRRYQVQYSHSIDPETRHWNNLSAELEASDRDGSFDFEDTPTGPQRYYRVVEVQAEP